MSKTKQIKISQCMIVKNEEKNIRQALSWGKGIVAEQIVVDTGSTDRTVEIAKEMGAKVYHFTWINDFAAAKNFAIEQASYEWIAFLDADEYFLEEDGKKLLLTLEDIQTEPLDAVLTAWVHLRDDGSIMLVESQVRIFRNRPDLRYHRRIHEQLARADGRNLQAWGATESLSIFHTGYGEEADKKKVASKRNLLLIQAELEDNPDDYEMYAYLGNEYLSFNELDSAEEAYHKAIALMPKKERGIYGTVMAGTFLRLFDLLIARSNDLSEITEAYQQAVPFWPKEGDYDYLLGKYYANHKQFPEAEYYLKNALDKVENYGNVQYSSLISAQMMKAYELLAMCCFNNGNIADCAKYATVLLKENPYLMTTAVLLISAFHQDMARLGREKDGAVEVAVLLGRSFYDFQSLKDRLFVLRAAMAAKYSELVEVIRGLFISEELEQVDRALGQ